jgi:hypothetical protein
MVKSDKEEWIEGTKLSLSPKLPLNLIPATSWWKNVRSKIPKSQWDTIRKKVYQQANYTCEICQAKNTRLDCNEVWDYQNNKQILIKLEAICRPCHLTQHMGYASIIGQHQAAFNHLLKVNGWTGEQGRDYVQAKFAEWEQRSKIEWILDLSYLEKY